jgi:shikimate dehydrogenase
MAKFGLIGKTLGHSFSKDYFEKKFETEQLSHSFENIELADISMVEEVLRNGGFSGLSVTIPYKETIIPFLDALSSEAQAIGAVNCIQFLNGKVIGHNTDAFGFHQSIKPFLTNQHERAMILGTGGASKAIAYVFKEIGVDVLFISRTPSSENQFGYQDINDYMLRACKVIVNCTPVGTFPDVNTCVDFPFHYLSSDHLVVDLIYNPSKTAFLSKAEAHGASILNGLSMLQEQASKAWNVWQNS